MRIRMLCTDCGATEHPSTVLTGSDRLEMLGWLCLVIPGWLYCASRHFLRAKACPRCGSESLVREARAAAHRRADAVGAETTVLNLHGPVRWPRPLASPRERLRQGSAGALIVAAAIACWIHAGLRPDAAARLLCAEIMTLVGVSWLLHAWVLVLWMRLRTPRCRAWRADGSPLQIEIL